MIRQKQNHARALHNNPDRLIRRKSLGSQLNKRDLRQGAISNHMTYNRIEFLARNVPPDLTIAEYLVSLLDNEIQRAKGSG